jgi:hypothetical protein
MPLWGKTDTTGNSCLYAPAQFKLAPNTANRDALYGNTTADSFVTGATVGQYAVDEAEMEAKRAEAATVGRPAHAGWILRTVGSGGRAGRIQEETLVALTSLTGDASDDTVAPDYGLVITLQPSNASGNSAADDVVVFSTNARSVPVGATIAYLWQAWDGNSFENLSNAGAYSNTATKALSVLANTAIDGEVYRCRVSATGATTEYTGNTTLTITS